MSNKKGSKMAASSTSTLNRPTPYALSLLAALMLAGTSLAGLIIPDQLYPEAASLPDYAANDLITLLIVLPLLFGMILLARQGNTLGHLLWPGPLLVILYNCLAYLVGMPPQGLSAVYLAILALSGVSFFLVLRDLDRTNLKELLSGRVPVRLSGSLLVVLGGIFLVRTIVLLFPVLNGETSLAAAELGVLIADGMISGVWLYGGILLLGRKPLGFAAGPGLMFATCILFISIILLVLVQSLLFEVPLNSGAVIVLVVMAAVFLTPAVLFLRGTIDGVKHENF